MKKTVCIITAVLLIISLFGCTSEDTATPPVDGEGEIRATEIPSAGPVTDEPEAPTDVPAPTDEPGPEALRLALLPEWHTEDAGAEWVHYDNVSPADVKAYANARVTEGFTLIQNDEGKWAKILYRGDAWIEISDNTDAYSYCDIKVSIGSRGVGMSADEAQAAIKAAAEAADRTWTNLSRGASRPLTAILDITPEGFFEATGMQLFRALFNAPPQLGVDDPVFSTAVFIAAGGCAKEIMCYDPAAADIDGDGETEAILLGYGPTSGFLSLIFEVFGMNEGKPESEALAGYALDHGDYSLAVHDGRPYLVRDGREFALSVEYGEVMIDDPDDLLSRELMAHFDW